MPEQRWYAKRAEDVMRETQHPLWVHLFIAALLVIVFSIWVVLELHKQSNFAEDNLRACLYDRSVTIETGVYVSIGAAMDCAGYPPGEIN
jgi:hypothetical protein